MFISHHGDKVYIVLFFNIPMNLELLKILAEIILYGISVVLIRYLGKRLERINKEDFLSLWLSEIGSDVRIYGVGTLSTIMFGIVIKHYVKGSGWFFLVIIKLIVSVWIFILVVAGLVVGEEYLKNNIEQSNISAIDKRNYLTLIPVVASIFKIISYACVTLAVLSSVGVNITPILNVGAIAIAALMFAGAETIKDVLATLKFFITRKLYVGSYVKINNFKVGKVTRITIIDTWVEFEQDGVTYTQIISNGLINTIVHIKPNKVIRSE